MTSDPRPPLIVLEGIDGAGTTTQAQRLSHWLSASGHLVHLTAEPSSGPVGQFLRSLLKQAPGSFDPHALALLFAADRRHHLTAEIQPMQAQGRIVISDRYLLSSLAYQSLTVDRDFVAAANAAAPAPDLTLLIDLPVQAAAQRRRARGGPVELFDDLAVQTAVARAYRQEAQRALDLGQNLVIVDGRPDPDTVFSVLAAAVASHLSSRPPVDPHRRLA